MKRNARKRRNKSSKGKIENKTKRKKKKIILFSYLLIEDFLQSFSEKEYKGHPFFAKP